MNGLDVLGFVGEGYAPVHAFNGWRVAIVNFAPRLQFADESRLEMHTETDEVFILLQGKATLYIGPKMERIPLESGKIYNVRCGVWHTITLEKDACVAIMENDDTGAHNTVKYVLLSLLFFV